MPVWHSVAVLWIVAAVAMTLGWEWQRRHRNAGIVDVVWAAATASGALLYAAMLHGAAMPRLLLALLGGLWGLRLALHLLGRVVNHPEDGRYRQLRDRWHGDQGKMFLMFQLQALLIVLFCVPFLAVATNRVNAVTLWTLLGIGIWTVSIAGEGLADRQLARFRANPDNRARTCREGLWGYSRHPNYLFEWLHWFTYVALAVGSPLFALSWSGPLVVYVFLRWLSGIPFTEAQALRTRGEDYREYQRHTPMLFPFCLRRK